MTSQQRLQQNKFACATKELGIRDGRLLFYNERRATVQSLPYADVTDVRSALSLTEH